MIRWCMKHNIVKACLSAAAVPSSVEFKDHHFCHFNFLTTKYSSWPSHHLSPMLGDEAKNYRYLHLSDHAVNPKTNMMGLKLLIANLSNSIFNSFITTNTTWIQQIPIMAMLCVIICIGTFKVSAEQLEGDQYSYSITVEKSALHVLETQSESLCKCKYLG